MKMPLPSKLRAAWYVKYVNREAVTGKFISKKYKGEKTIIQLDRPVTVRSQGVEMTAPVGVSVTFVMLGSGDILRSLFFLAGKDVNYTDLFKRNLTVVFDLVKNEALKVIRTGEGVVPNKIRYARRKAGRVTENGKIVLPFKQSWGTNYESYVDPSAKDHPLGRLSGELYEGVRRRGPGGLDTRPIKKYGKYNLRWRNKMYNKLKELRRFENLDLDRLESVYGDMHAEYVEPRDFQLVTHFTEPEYIKYVHDGKEKTLPRPFFSVANSMASAKISKYWNEVIQTLSLEHFAGIQSVLVFDEKALEEFMDEEQFLSEIKTRPKTRPKLRKIGKLLEYGSMLNPSSEDYKYIWSRVGKTRRRRKPKY